MQTSAGKNMKVREVEKKLIVWVVKILKTGKPKAKSKRRIEALFLSLFFIKRYKESIVIIPNEGPVKR
jgi:hypothetical protein